MKILDIVEILRKDNKHYLWNKRKVHFTETDWLVLYSLKNGIILNIDDDMKKGICKSKKVVRISDGKVYENGKKCYLDNNISKSRFYALITNRRVKTICEFKYI